MLTLRNITTDDAPTLQHLSFPRMPLDAIQNMITDWNKNSYNNRYFEMFAVIYDNNIIGLISIYEHSDNVVSIGPEIFPEYRKQGYGFQAMEKAMTFAKEKEYKIISQQVRTNNTASQKLHVKLGFETDGYVYKNMHGNDVFIFLKSIA